MKVYEAVYNENETEGVYALSVVENPAMQDMWIALSEQPETIEFSEVDEDKRLLLGASLIPNKKIYRNIDGNEFYITFSEDTIEKLAHNFLKQQNNNNSSLEHETKLNDMSVVESWIVQDPEKDKSNLYGKTYERGTWVAMMKVDNDDVWSKVKSGEVKGFSIDALLKLKEVNLKSDIIMNEDTKKSIVSEVIDGVKTLLNLDKPKEDVEEVEVVVEAAPQENQELDIKALTNQIKEALQAEFKAQNEAKEKEIETLKAELSKQAEKEDVKVTPEAAPKRKIELKSNTIETTKSRAMSNIAEAMGWK